MPLSTKTPLPADLPQSWEDGQTISADGVEAGLTRQHGYNYLSGQINDTQIAVNEIDTNVSNRISELTPYLLTLPLSAAWTVCTSYDGAAYSGGDLWMQQAEAPEVAENTCLTVLADNTLAKRMEDLGVTALWPETANGSVTFYARGAKFTAAMEVSCLAQTVQAKQDGPGPLPDAEEGEQG